MCCTGLLCSQSVLLKEAENRRKCFDKMENKTVNIVYESICRFGEEETREMKQSYEQTQINEDRRLLVNRKLS